MKDENAGKNKIPSLGQQYVSKSATGPLIGRLINGEITKEEYERLRMAMPLWRRIWEEQAEALFWGTAYLVFMLWLIFLR